MQWTVTVWTICFTDISQSNTESMAATTKLHKFTCEAWTLKNCKMSEASFLHQHFLWWICFKKSYWRIQLIIMFCVIMHVYWLCMSTDMHNQFCVYICFHSWLFTVTSVAPDAQFCLFRILRKLLIEGLFCSQSAPATWQMLQIIAA